MRLSKWRKLPTTPELGAAILPLPLLAHHRRRQFLFDLYDRNHRKKLGEEKKPEKKPGKASRRYTDVHPGRKKKPPGIWIIFVSEGGYDDHKALHPHPDIDQNGNAKKPGSAGSNRLDKEQQRDKRVKEDHDPEGNGIFSCDLKGEVLPFRNVVAVPGNVSFHDVGVAYDQAGEDDELGEILEVRLRQVGVETENPPIRNEWRRRRSKEQRSCCASRER